MRKLVVVWDFAREPKQLFMDMHTKEKFTPVQIEQNYKLHHTKVLNHVIVFIYEEKH